jgi:glycosyltransferase involved in cell wall biosynthesis
MEETIWLTWEHQLRNRSMARKIGADLYVIDYKGKSLPRYFICMWRTLSILLKRKPKIVFAQNPSIALTLFLLCFRPLLGYKLVSDAHFAGIIAYNGNVLLQKTLDICNRFVDIIIVTNEDHACYARKIGGRPFVCEDPLPDLSAYVGARTFIEKKVFIICSFDIDEPFIEVFNATEMLTQKGYTFYVSGNFLKAGIEPERYPSVHFLGYVPESTFYTHLFESHVVLDFTNNENCLLCGAYEAMAAEKPLVTSNTEALRNYFTHGTVFTKHDRISIEQAIETAYENQVNLKEEIKDWRVKAEDAHDKKIKYLRELLSQ